MSLIHLTSKLKANSGLTSSGAVTYFTVALTSSLDKQDNASTKLFDDSTRGVAVKLPSFAGRKLRSNIQYHLGAAKKMCFGDVPSSLNNDLGGYFLYIVDFNTNLRHKVSVLLPA
jgi:hypothetical protein